MNIILFVNKDLEANLAYHLLKDELLQHNVRIYYSASVGKSSQKPQALQQIEYYEKNFFFGELQETVLAHKIPTNFEFFGDDFKTFPMIQCHKVNSPEFIEEVRSFEPDLFISIRFGKIFKDDIINVPKKGILNLHSAILPDYRGIMGTLHNLKDPKEQYGCTLHYIDSGTIDTGQIITIAKKEINKDRSLLWHIIQLYPMGCQLIIDSIQKLTSIDRLPSQSQDMNVGNYYSLPTEQDFKLLKENGIVSFKSSDYMEILSKYISSDLLNHISLR